MSQTHVAYEIGLQTILPLDEDIDYSVLSADQLETLTKQGDPYIATSALIALHEQCAPLSGEVAWRILTGFEGDRHLHAVALPILFEIDRTRALSYLAKVAEHGSPYMLGQVMSLILDNPEFFHDGRGLSIARLVDTRVQEDLEGVSVDKDLRRRFAAKYAE